MRKLPNFLVASVFALSAGIGVAGCGGGSASQVNVPSVATSPSVIIDVRSAAEYAAGHVEGSVNYDVEDGALAGQLAHLDKNAPYAVYCRSGRRSAIAADMMKSAGFTHVTDLGAMENAAASLNKNIVTN